MRLRRAARALLIAAAIALAGCAGDDNPGDDKPGDSSSASQSSSSAAGVERELQVSTDLERKPTLSSLPGLPPMELVTKDVVTGSGRAAKAGEKVTVQYVGVAYSSDKEFDSSWGKKPFETTLVSPGIVEGWVKGIPGMKEGGRRALVIPPDLGYGEAGSPPDIAPYETLVFVIDLKQVG